MPERNRDLNTPFCIVVCYSKACNDMSNQFNLQRISEPTDVAELESAWDTLGGQVPFRNWAWLGNWWNAYGDNNRLYVAAAFDADKQLTGASPWFRSRSFAQGRKIQLLGSGKACTDYLTIVADEQVATDMPIAMADWLTEQANDDANGWDLLELDNIPINDMHWAKFLERMEARGNTVAQQSAQRCWSIQNLEGWEEYLARISKSHRKQLRRIVKRELAGPQLAFQIAEDEESFETGWSALVDLHQKRWAARGIDGCFTSEAFHDYLKTASLRLLADGKLDLGWLEDEGRPVAAQLDIRSATSSFAYQAGVDPEVEDYGPGQVLQTAMLKRAADAGVSRYDFLRGDEPYKAHWRAEPTECITLRVTPRKPMAQLRSSVWSAGQQLKRWIRSSQASNEAGA